MTNHNLFLLLLLHLLFCFVGVSSFRFDVGEEFYEWLKGGVGIPNCRVDAALLITSYVFNSTGINKEANSKFLADRQERIADDSWKINFHEFRASDWPRLANLNGENVQHFEWFPPVGQKSAHLLAKKYNIHTLPDLENKFVEIYKELVEEYKKD